MARSGNEMPADVAGRTEEYVAMCHGWLSSRRTCEPWLLIEYRSLFVPGKHCGMCYRTALMVLCFIKGSLGAHSSACLAQWSTGSVFGVTIWQSGLHKKLGESRISAGLFQHETLNLAFLAHTFVLARFLEGSKSRATFWWRWLPAVSFLSAW